MIAGIDLHSVNIDTDCPPEGPANNEEYTDDEQRNDDLYDYPHCALPAGLVVIPFVERCSDWLQDCQVAHQADVQDEPEGGEVIAGVTAVDDIDDQEKWLELGLEQGEDYEDFAEDVDCAGVGLILVGVDGEDVEIHQEEEDADDYGDDDEKGIHLSLIF